MDQKLSVLHCVFHVPVRCQRFDLGLPLSALNNFSQDKRARGQPAGQEGTVAAVSDRQETPSMCVLQAGVKYLSGL